MLGLLRTLYLCICVFVYLCILHLIHKNAIFDILEYHLLKNIAHAGPFKHFVIHSKSEKVCGTAFSDKKLRKKCVNPGIIFGSFDVILGHFGSFLGHFGSFWVIIGPFWAIWGHIWVIFGPLWIILGHI